MERKNPVPQARDGATWAGDFFAGVPLRLVVATGAGLTLLGLVDPESATADFLAVEGVDGLLGGGVVHLHEAESAEAAGLAVVDELHGQDFAVLAEQVAKIFLRGAERNVADVDRLRHAIKLLKKQ